MKPTSANLFKRIQPSRGWRQMKDRKGSESAWSWTTEGVIFASMIVGIISLVIGLVGGIGMTVKTMKSGISHAITADAETTAYGFRIQPTVYRINGIPAAIISPMNKTAKTEVTIAGMGDEGQRRTW